MKSILRAFDFIGAGCMIYVACALLFRPDREEECPLCGEPADLVRYAEQLLICRSCKSELDWRHDHGLPNTVAEAEKFARRHVDDCAGVAAPSNDVVEPPMLFEWYAIERTENGSTEICVPSGWRNPLELGHWFVEFPNGFRVNFKEHRRAAEMFVASRSHALIPEASRPKLEQRRAV